MANLSIRRLREIGEYELGARPGGPLEHFELVNLAGRHLVSMFPWKWLEGRQARLRPRAAIELTGATWTEATKTLTKVAAFTSYTFLDGDTVSVTDGTGATVGTYAVASKTSADAIVLVTSIGAAANGQTDIEADLPNDHIALPSDFDIQQILGYSMTNGLLGQMEFTDEQSMLNLRNWPGGGRSTGFWALVRWVRTAANVRAVPHLELWPASSSAEEEMVIFYRGGWVEVADDDDDLSLPQAGWLDPLFIEVFKAVVMGHEESEGGSVDDRLAKLQMGITFQKAAERDALFQPDHGPVENGWTDRPWRGISRFDFPAETPIGF